jgi:hypothetical protein
MGSTDRMRYLPWGLGASLVQAAIMFSGYHEDGKFQATEWFVMLAISLVMAALVFTLVVPRGGATTGLVLGIVACVTVLAFWAMLSLPLAAAALVVGNRARASGDAKAGMAKAAVGLGALAVVATIAVTIGDAMAN